MTRGFRASAMILAGLPLEDLESRADEAVSACVRAGIASFLLPGALLLRPAVLAELVSMIRARSGEARVGPALIAVGGGPSPAFGLPYVPGGLWPLGLAAAGGKAGALRAGMLLGRAIDAAGLDLVLGPRLDLATDPKDRSGVLDGFGEEPRTAASLGSAFVRGLARSRIASCVGRFPGLGATAFEGVGGFPLVPFPADRLEAAELVPFAAAVRAGCAAVLVGRALVPSLEPERIPAARSARVVEGYLRAGLRFKGLAIGDDLEGERDLGRAALLGALAGCDLSLAASPAAALAAAERLESAASSGDLPEPRILVSKRRLSRFLLRRAATTRRRPSSAKAAAVARKIEQDRERALTLLRGPIRGPVADEGLLVAVFAPPQGSPEAGELPGVLAALRAGLPQAEVIGLPADPGTADVESAGARLAERRFAAAAILTYDAHLRPAQEGLARMIEESTPRATVVAMRDPYDAAFFPRAGGLVAAYGFSAGGAAAVARLLAGEIEARGRSPVDVIGIEL